MINQLLGKVFGTKNERVVKSLMPKVQAINALEPEMQKLTDAELRAKTDEFRQRIQERLSRFGGGNGNPPPGSEALPDRKTKMISTASSASKKSSTKRCRKFSTRFWWRPLPWSARPDGAYLTCGTSTCS